ncbi:hypothetical protein F0562_027560 [Nyssa sinensis]|uniref:Uncharacterized protein n=1 Tax=Nyssa sinensis TaxID=561372 RepID=A0A5J5B5H5_9ASTE|nr:hypothetical protein F0562_027560 [Nyssa sinensis]
MLYDMDAQCVTSESSRAFLKNTFVERWGDPLMGWSCWTSTGDPYANVGDAGLSFDGPEAAERLLRNMVGYILIQKLP